MNAKQMIRAAMAGVAALGIVASTTLLAPAAPASAQIQWNPLPDIKVTFESELNLSTWGNVIKATTYSFTVSNEGTAVGGPLVVGECFYQDIAGKHQSHTLANTSSTVGAIAPGGKQIVQFTCGEHDNLGPSGAKLMAPAANDSNPSNNAAQSPGYK